MEINKIYLHWADRYNHALLHHGCHFFSNDDKSSELIFICEGCLFYFEHIYQSQNFFLKELKKCLLEKFWKKAKSSCYLHSRK